MRTTRGVLLVLGLALLAARPAGAGERDAALAVVERALKAHGGADALAKMQTAVRTSTGTMALFNKEVSFHDEITWHLPERFRLTLDVGTGQDKTRLVLVVTQDKGWQLTGGMVMDLTPERLSELHEEAYVLLLQTLLPLSKDADFQLTPLPEAKVDGRPADAIKVAHKEHADARLFFDKDTGLLAKIERRVREAGLMVDKQYLYGNYKEFDGLQLPTQITELVNTKPFTSLAGIDYRFPRTISDSTFAKP